jgi:replicative DNA helicase
MHYNDEAESYVMSALLDNPETFYDIDTILTADDLYYTRNRTLFKAIKYLFDKGSYDVRTLVHILREKNKLDEVGGVAYIGELRAVGGNKLLAKVYAERVKEHSLYRNADAIAVKIKEEIAAAKENGDIGVFTNKVSELFNSFNPSRESRMRHISEAVVSAKEKSKQPNISPLLGFSHIDKWMKGIGTERLIVIAGRPGTGKTAFSLTACRNIARQGYGAVPVFSMEMSGEELVNRMLADMSGVPFQTIMTHSFQGEQENVVEKARQRLCEIPLYIDDTPRMDYDHIVSQCRQRKRENGKLGAVMIDYLGLVKLYMKKNQNKSDAIGEITGDLKRLTRELGCSIILLAQMSRKFDDRSGKNKRPVLSDLKDSGNIEQDADMVIFLHNDKDKAKGNKDHIDFIVEKGRQTGVADFELWFNGAIQRFEVKE